MISNEKLWSDRHIRLEGRVQMSAASKQGEGLAREVHCSTQLGAALTLTTPAWKGLGAEGKAGDCSNGRDM